MLGYIHMKVLPVPRLIVRIFIEQECPNGVKSVIGDTLLDWSDIWHFVPNTEYYIDPKELCFLS